MLLYNHKQEFLGIDDEGLRLLNYASLDDLLHVCSDVADLFANEPGYIHNFKNFGWIDFLLHADSDASSAIVHGKGRTFSCQLSVTPFYLCDEPTKPGYNVEMLQVKNLSGEEFKPHVIPPKAPSSEPTFAPLQTNEPASPSPLPNYDHITPTQLSEPSVFDIPSIEPSSLDDLIDLAPPPSPLPLLDQESLLDDVYLPETVDYTETDKEYLSQLKISDGYRFDPQVAANELGLPVDLIEEFIGDFIQQAHAFKEELFAAALKSDFNNLHILSHKLKGVAANLRVEDALEALTIINASTDLPEIEANLKHFYAIIAKLDGEEPIIETRSAAPKAPQPVPSISHESDEDIYTFDLKQHDDEPLMIEDTYNLDDLIKPIEENKEHEEAFNLDDVIKISEPQDVPSAETKQSEPDIELPETVVLHYDIKAMSGTLGIEPEFLHELLDDYKKDALAISESILTSINAFDTHTWRENAARFIGISDNLRLSEISEEFSIIATTNDAQKAKQASLRLSGYLDQLH